MHIYKVKHPWWTATSKTKPKDNLICSHLLTKWLFCKNFSGASYHKTSLSKVVEEYTFIKEMAQRPLNFESFGHNFHLVTTITKVVKEMPCLQNVHFIKAVSSTETGVLYPRSRDFYSWWLLFCMKRIIINIYLSVYIFGGKSMGLNVICAGGLGGRSNPF